MSIETRIQAINDHLIDDYKVLRLAGADLTGVNKNIVNLKMSWKERLLYFMNNGTDDVWNNWEKVSGTGTTLSLNNTEEAPMSLVYKGNTSQNGTPTPTSPIPVQVVSGDNSIEVVGKNLFSSQLETGSYEAGAKVAYAGFYRSTDKISIQPNTTYTLSINGVSQRYVLSFYNSSGTFISQNSSLTNGTFTSVNNAYYITIRCFQTDYTSNYANLKIQLEKGSTASTYEAYKGASYPISLGNKELCKIGTYQDKIDKSTGKNLFDESILDTKKVSEDDDCYIFDNNTLFKVNLTPNVTFKENTSYTIQYIAKQVGTGNPRLIIFYTDGTYENVGVAGISTTLTTYTQISNANKTIDYISGIYGGIGSFYIKKNSVLVYEGSIQNPVYEPYGTGWYLKKEIGKVVLNGSETKWYTFGGANYEYQSIISDGYSGSDYKPSISNRYVNNNVTGANLQNYQYSCFIQSGELYVRFRHNDITTLADYKTWLGTNNVTVYYPLATPTYETITDTTLLSQLDEAKKSYEEQTNISQVNDDMPFELNITALSNE